MKTLAPIWQFDIRTQAASLKTDADEFVKRVIPVYWKRQTFPLSSQRKVLRRAGKAITPFDRRQEMEAALYLTELSDKKLLRHWLILRSYTGIQTIKSVFL